MYVYNMSIYMTGSMKIKHVVAQNCPIFLNITFVIPILIHYINAEFNGGSYKAYTMKILFPELKIFINI